MSQQNSSNEETRSKDAVFHVADGPPTHKCEPKIESEIAAECQTGWQPSACLSEAAENALESAEAYAEIAVRDLVPPDSKIAHLEQTAPSSWELVHLEMDQDTQLIVHYLFPNLAECDRRDLSDAKCWWDSLKEFFFVLCSSAECGVGHPRDPEGMIIIRDVLSHSTATVVAKFSPKLLPLQKEILGFWATIPEEIKSVV